MNHKAIVQKCLQELKEEKPDISYVKGMLEALVSEGEQPPTSTKTLEHVRPIPTNDPNTPPPPPNLGKLK